MFVVAAAADGDADACLVGFTTQCSIEPPRFAVFLSKMNQTYRARDAGHRARRAPDPPRPARARRALRRHQREGRSRQAVRMAVAPRTGRRPVIEECDWFAGTIEARLDAGDHVAFVLAPFDGRVPGRRPAGVPGGRATSTPGSRRASPTDPGRRAIRSVTLWRHGRAHRADPQPRRPVRSRRRRRSGAAGAGRRRRAPHLRRAGGARQPVGPPPDRPRHRARRLGGDLLVEPRRVGRGDDRLLQGPRGADQRQLPLRRSRARVPVRQRRPPRAHLRARVLAAGGEGRARAAAARRVRRHRGRHRARRLAGRARRGLVRGRARRRRPRTRLRAAQQRRSLRALHRRHHRHAQGREVEERGHLPRRDERCTRQRAARLTRGPRAVRRATRLGVVRARHP